MCPASAVSASWHSMALTGWLSKAIDSGFHMCTQGQGKESVEETIKIIIIIMSGIIMCRSDLKFGTLPRWLQGQRWFS